MLAHDIAPALHRTGVTKHVTPHVLRHTCAVHMLEGGAGVREVQMLLAHAMKTKGPHLRFRFTENMVAGVFSFRLPARLLSADASLRYSCDTRRS
jgi:integrase